MKWAFLSKGFASEFVEFELSITASGFIKYLVTYDSFLFAELIIFRVEFQSKFYKGFGLAESPDIDEYIRKMQTDFFIFWVSAEFLLTDLGRVFSSRLQASCSLGDTAGNADGNGKQAWYQD